MTELRAPERIGTGIAGLDTILDGGLLVGGVYIVEGLPGSGKTILGNQLCFHRASRGDSTIYVTLLAESHTRMIAHLRGMAFFRPELIASSVYYISAFKVLEQDGLEGLLRTIRDAQLHREAKLLVIDGLVSAEEVAPSARDFRKFIHELQTISALTGATVILLASTGRAHPHRAEHTMVDGILEMTETLVGVRSVRGIIVRKMRGTSQLRGRHALEITGAGIEVQPRIEAMLRAPDESDPAPAQLHPASFGVTGLDAMLRGGLPGGSSTVIVGPSGSGKTVLGLQFLAEGARRSEPGLYVGFFERPHGLIAKAQRLELGLDTNLVKLIWEATTEGVLDGVVARVLREVDRHQIKRLVFDGLHGFRHHAEFPERTRAVFTALADRLSRTGVTSIFTVETADLLGPRLEIPIEGISALADNLVLLRHVELRSQLFRLISILKIRDHHYDSRIREFQITDRGLIVADTFESAEQILTGTARVVPDAGDQ